MNIIIRETKERFELGVTDPDSSVDWVIDFIGNNGGFDNDQFVYDDDAEAYICSKDTYEWWSKVCAENEALEERIY